MLELDLMDLRQPAPLASLHVATLDSADLAAKRRRVRLFGHLSIVVGGVDIRVTPRERVSPVGKLDPRTWRLARAEQDDSFA
ncbi:MAG: hypothetical protein ACRDTT_30395, partial [Pseudonocardiaceae bacterium]